MLNLNTFFYNQWAIIIEYCLILENSFYSAAMPRGKRVNIFLAFLKLIYAKIFRFDDPWISFTEKITNMIPSMLYIPPFSYFNKKFLAMLEELFGELCF